MLDIEFNLNQSIIIIQANLEESFHDVINKYLQKTLLNPESVCFFVNGQKINPYESIESHMSKEDAEKKV